MSTKPDPFAKLREEAKRLEQIKKDAEKAFATKNAESQTATTETPKTKTQKPAVPRKRKEEGEVSELPPDIIKTIKDVERSVDAVKKEYAAIRKESEEKEQKSNKKIAELENRDREFAENVKEVLISVFSLQNLPGTTLEADLGNVMKRVMATEDGKLTFDHFLESLNKEFDIFAGGDDVKVLNFNNFVKWLRLNYQDLPSYQGMVKRSLARDYVNQFPELKRDLKITEKDLDYVSGNTNNFQVFYDCLMLYMIPRLYSNVFKEVINFVKSNQYNKSLLVVDIMSLIEKNGIEAIMATLAARAQEAGEKLVQPARKGDGEDKSEAEKSE